MRKVDAAISIKMGTRSFTLERKADLEALWESLGENADETHIPYWTELWPASLALAEWLEIQVADIRNKTLMDIGCGLGFLSIMAKVCGALVLGMDFEMDALVWSRHNSNLNGVAPALAQMDWAMPACRKGVFERIIGSDILYEARFINPLAAFLAYSLSAHGKAWIADPGRSFFNDFIIALSAHGLASSVVHEKVVDSRLTGSIPIKVKIWQIGSDG